MELAKKAQAQRVADILRMPIDATTRATRIAHLYSAGHARVVEIMSRAIARAAGAPA